LGGAGPAWRPRGRPSPPARPAPVMTPPAAAPVNGGGSPGTTEPAAPVSAPPTSTTASTGGITGTTEPTSPAAPVASIPVVGDNPASPPSAVETKKDAESPLAPTTIITKPAESTPPAPFPQP